MLRSDSETVETVNINKLSVLNCVCVYNIN